MTPIQLVWRAYLKSRLRGRTRLTLLLARRLKSLQAVPVRIADCAALYVDLREGLAHHLVIGDPWEQAPWEQDEQSVMRQVVRPGDTAFDIGANLGLHSVLLASLVGSEGRLYAFEPNSELHHVLDRTFRNLPNAVLLRCALSNEAVGSGVLFHPGDHLKVSLADWTAPWKTNARTLPCQIDTIDKLVARGVIASPDFIKCDVEGAELRVFQGAMTVLNRNDAPIVLFEANAATAAGFGLGLSEAKKFLEALPVPEYQFFEVGPKPILSPLVEITAAHSNVLAVPAGRLPGLSSKVGSCDC